MNKSLFIFIFQLVLMGMAVACAPTVPPLSVLGKWHTVDEGETVESIANKYGVAKEEIAELNQVALYDRLTEQIQLFIPLGKGSPPGDGKPVKTQAAPAVRASAQDSDSAPAAGASGPTVNAAATRSVKSNCDKDGHHCFLWPVNGTLLRGFGDKAGVDSAQSDGIDIQAPRGADVMAAGNGEVIYSGNAIKGYGNLILVQHENNVITVYAHNERNLVKEGTKVMRGEKIAEVGDSGAATVTLLHFEVRVNETPVDPMLYLPGKE